MQPKSSNNYIDREILRLALPAIFSNITIPLLGLSDTYISGHLGSERYIAAIAVGSMMINSVYWLFGFLRAGTTGLTAEAFGRGDSQQQKRIFTLSFSLAIVIGLGMMLLSWPLMRLMVMLMSPEGGTARLASEYFMICVMASPALLATMTVNGWLIGCQNTLYPMIGSISINIINIIASFSLVFGLDMGFYGVALGTLIANWVGLAVELLLASKVAGGNPFLPLRGLLKRVDLPRFFKVNSDLMLRSCCVLSVTFAMTAFGGRMGDLILAANAIVMQLFLFFSYFSDGFAYSGEAMCGRFAGALDITALRSTIRELLRWCGVLAIIFFLIYILFTPDITSFLTDNAGVIEKVTSLRWIVGIIPPLSVVAFMLDGVYIGLTDTRRMLLANLAGTILYFSLYLLPQKLGWIINDSINNILLWASFLLFLSVRGIVLSSLLPGILRRLEKHAINKFHVTH